MDLNILKIISFTKILNKFREVERVTYSSGGERCENDVEHSYQLTMLAWYIISSNNLNLDIDLVLKYTLIHDLVEIYAGDTYVYTKNKKLLESKKRRENESLQKLKKEFPEFPELFSLINQYEQKKDVESRFVYALDKIEPILLLHTTGGKTWKDKKITIEMLVQNKKDKVAKSPELVKCFDDLIKILRKEEKTLFCN